MKPEYDFQSVNGIKSDYPCMTLLYTLSKVM